ncbi:MAG: hypothetical protein LBT86_02570 [Deltaproteobacteria bacterium]|jgi:hypothetical protein|nr:hypothetical protein [Deltaproteobacteria bacterium]
MTWPKDPPIDSHPPTPKPTPAAEPTNVAEQYNEVNQVFLANLASGTTVLQAARRAGKSMGCFAGRRRSNPEFAAQWEEAVKIGSQFEEGLKHNFLNLINQGMGANMASHLTGRNLKYFSDLRERDPAFNEAWRNAQAEILAKRLASIEELDITSFLSAISSGQSIDKASKDVGTTKSQMYFFKKHLPQFAQQWERAMETKLALLESRSSPDLHHNLPLKEPS